MSIKIGSNLASLNAQRRLGEATTSLSGIYEKLSSGKRINRASDDAAGLAIADDLNAKGRIYTQGIRNGNDGISLLNIADSAIDALSEVVTRIRELSGQAANGTYSNEQRQALDAEAQALSKEFTRITQTTSFNGINIFDGSLGSGVRLQLGIGITESINASIGGAVGDGTVSTLIKYNAQARGSTDVELGDLDGDGILDLVSSGYNDSSVGQTIVRLGIGDGSFGSATTYASETGNSMTITLGDLNADGILDLVTGGQDIFQNGIATVRLGNGDGTFGAAISYSTEGYSTRDLVLGDINGDSVLDLITAGYDDSFNGYASVRLGRGNGTFGNATQYLTEPGRSYGVEIGDLNGDGKLDLVTVGYDDDNLIGFASVRLGNGNGTFGTLSSFSTQSALNFAMTLGDINNDNILDMVYGGFDDNFAEFTAVKLGNGNGTFESSSIISSNGITPTSYLLTDMNGDGNVDLVTSGILNGTSGYGSIRLGNANGQFSDATLFSAIGRNVNGMSVGDLNGDGISDLVLSGTETGIPSYDGIIAVRIGSTKNGLGAINSFSLQTKADALQSMGMLDRTLENLAKQRGTIGASQSRVNIAISNLQTSKENFAAAESRIRDADIAAEAANLVRTQILQQAAASVLSQANQQPNLALQLLS